MDLRFSHAAQDDVVGEGGRPVAAGAAFAMASGAGGIELFLGRGKTLRLRPGGQRCESRDHQRAGKDLHHGIGPFAHFHFYGQARLGWFARRFFQR